MGSRLAILVLAAGLTVSGGATVSVFTPVERMQKALAALEAKDLVRAQRAGERLAASGEQDAWRAWIVAAAARQRQGKYFEARDAYRRYLCHCTDPAERAYVLEQMRLCGRGAKSAPVTVFAKALTGDRRKELSVVEAESYTDSSAHFLVQAHNSALAKLVAEQAELALTRICRDILSGQEYPHDVSIFVWADANEYARNANSAPEWSGGAFSIKQGRNGQLIRRIDLTQLDGDGTFDPIMLDRVLPHEMTHLVLAEYFGDARCPLTVNEGLAMLAEAEADNSRLLLAGVVLSGDGKIPLGELLAAERCTAKNAKVFYAESFSLMSYLHARMTGQQFKDMLEQIKNGLPLDEAVQRALYVPCDPNFLDCLAKAWATDALKQSQFLQALAEKS